MSGGKTFLLRLDNRFCDVPEKWVSDDLRSVNAQMEYLLTEAARKAGRISRTAGGGSKEEE
jgi:hypothetical protein